MKLSTWRRKCVCTLPFMLKLQMFLEKVQTKTWWLCSVSQSEYNTELNNCKRKHKIIFKD